MVTSQITSSVRHRISVISIVPYLIMTFSIAWAILALYIFLPVQMTGIFGQLSGTHPLFYLAVWAPAISAFTIIVIKEGINGLMGFLARIKLWRTSMMWYFFLIVGVPVIFYAGAALKGNLLTDPFPFATLQSLLVALLLSVIKGPVEEFGWRGFALPLMQRKFAPFWAAIILGIIWGLWHLPAFIISGTQQSSWAFMPFFLGTITISIIITALYNATRGSILLAAFLHFQFMNPIWPDAQPYDTYLLIVIAIIIVWFNRENMFTKKSGIVEVIPNINSTRE